MTSLDEQVSGDSWARIVDLFVDAIPIDQFGFTHSTLNKEGNIPYHPSDMFKLLLYGYRYRIRSANQLARSCKINIEVKWLLKTLEPSARTINYFRSNNTQAIKEAHRYFVGMLKQWKLIDGKTLVVDGTRIRAQNSKGNNYTERKINTHLKWIEGSIEKYLEKLAALEQKSKKNREDTHQIRALKQELSKRQERKKKYEGLKREVKHSKDKQVSKVDRDARSMGSSRDGIQVGYNMQGIVDSKHNLIVDMYSGQVNDAHELSKGARRAKEKLDTEGFDLLADKGYHTGSEMMQCAQLNVRTYVSPKEALIGRKDGYSKADFTYHAESDTYRCPEHQILTTNGKIYKRSDRDEVKRYRSNACKHCPQLAICSPNRRKRVIERSVYQEYKDENDKRVNENPQYYKWRMHIEHVFGTIKRSWNLSYTLVRGRQKVENEYRLAPICYNLNRSVSILGMERVKEELKRLILILFEYLSPHKRGDKLIAYPAIHDSSH